MQLEKQGAALEPSDDRALLAAGTQASGEFHCAACGYGISVRVLLPQCPMCRGIEWEQSATSPYAGRRL